MARILIRKKTLGKIKSRSLISTLALSGINIPNGFALILFSSYFILLFLAFWFINDINEKEDLKSRNNNGVITYSLEKEAPDFTWIFSPYDISQEYYMINPHINYHTKAIVIDSRVVTDFNLLSIEPDLKTNYSIRYDSKDKLAKISQNGLSFYSKFPDYQNKQSIRIFVLTALLSLLIHECLKKLASILKEVKSNENHNEKIVNQEKKKPS